MKEVDIDFKDVKKVHFVGIGGIGVSAIARKMLEEGKEVSGSDGSESEILEMLRTKGAQVYIGHEGVHVPEDADVLVYTIAALHENPELGRARELGIPTLTYPQALGALTKNYFTIAVAGTHGKTTTTAMLADILINAGLDPTVVVGSIVKKWGNSNYRGGSSKYFIVEACEYQRSFLHLNPNVIIITNIDADHLDYYRDISDILLAFKEFVSKLPSGGSVVSLPKDTHVAAVLDNFGGNIIDYSAINGGLVLSVPGAHNRQNAQAAISASNLLDVDHATAIESLKDFEGTWRRAEFKGKTPGGALVYDDYAHHPTEVRATLSGFREKYPDKKIHVIFQPHLYSRTKYFLDDFGESFGAADAVIVLPIYAARETDDPEIDSTMLAEKIEHARYADSFDEAEKILGFVGENDMVITVGAGDVHKIAHSITH